MAIFPKILLFAPIALLFACSSSETAGGTTETENAIAMEGDGTVSIHVFAGKSEASRIAYRVLPSWFVPDTTGEIAEEDYTYRGTADSTGKIVIENHKQGSFTIQIGSKDSVIAYQYTLNNLSEKFDVKHASLTANGSVKGWISVPENAKYGWVHIPGTGKVQKTDSLGNFVINGVPSGDLVLRAWDTDTKECIAEAETRARGSPERDCRQEDHANQSEQAHIQLDATPHSSIRTHAQTRFDQFQFLGSASGRQRHSPPP